MNSKASKTTKVFAQRARGSRERFFFFFFVIVFVFVIVYVTDNVDDRASCLVPQRFRHVASADVDAALPAPTLIRGFFFKPWPARTSAVLIGATTLAVTQKEFVSVTMPGRELDSEEG